MTFTPNSKRKTGERYLVRRTAAKAVAKTVVIKLGGSALDNENVLSELSTTVAGYRTRGYRVVLIHGGGPAINKELNLRGITWSFINGQRVTTPEMIDVIDTVLSQQVNDRVVDSLRANGLPAAKLSGAANAILLCRQANAELGLVGQVEDVSTEQIIEVLTRNEVPVIAPVGLGIDDTSLKFNVNADWAATKIAVALKAEKLIFLTDQNGILDGEKKLVKSADPRALEGMIEQGVVSGGMCTKVLAMMSALRHGVAQVRVLNASASSGILSRAKVGTTLTESKVGTTLTETRNVIHGYAS